MKTKRVNINTLESLLGIAMDKCRNCNHLNICVYVMREHCVKEIINEQLK